MVNPKLRDLLLEKKIKYDLKNLGGGFKDGVEVTPGQGQMQKQISISATLYGGGTKEYHSFDTPKRVQQNLSAFHQAQASGDAVGPEIQQDLARYYDEVKKEISKDIVKLLQVLDKKVYQIMQNGVQRVNARYSQQAPQKPATTAPPAQAAPQNPTPPPTK